MLFRSRKIKGDLDCEVFISYAHEDKRFVRRLAKQLAARGLRIWFDEDSMDLGSSIIDLISEGIKSSKYVIAVLSKPYFTSKWTRAELKMLVQKEFKMNELSLLPIWHNVDFDDVFKHFPIIADRFSIKSSAGLSKVTYSIMKRIRVPDTYPMFSAKLSSYLAEIELQTGKRIHIIDIQKESIPKSAIMPGTPVPPFNVDPDFRNEIKFYYAPNILPKNDEEATVASVLTSINLLFEGFPQSRLSPIKAMVYGKSTKFDPYEIDAIQKWLHQGLLSLEAERRVCARGFVRDSVHAQVIDTSLSRLGMSLPARSLSVIQAIDRALLIAGMKYRIVHEEYKKHAIQILETASNTSLESDANRIVDLIIENETMTPRQFVACYEGILALWDLHDFIELGYVDKKTGYVKSQKRSFFELYRDLRAHSKDER